MKKVLLREFFELKCDERGCQDLLTEGEKKMVAEGHLVFPAKLQEADAVNGNQRVYTEEVLRKEINNYQKIVEDRRALGECDHPDDSVVNLKNASHMVNRIWWEGKDVIGTVKVLQTPAGQILRGLYESGVKFGFSSRALGSLQEGKGGVQYVQDDLQLICFDAVSEPSAPGAYILEGKEATTLTETIHTKGDRINRALNEILK
jgi:hypothetical protein|tara:strand:- start:531 stop:1142 length:612 start_codon:yes stop_codon:yes gene_type:complete